MKVLVTRPAADAARTAAALAERGHTCVVAPMVEIKACPAQIPERDYQAILVTSANAVRTLGPQPAGGALRGVPVIAVGDASADAARAAGITEVDSAGGAADDLVEMVRARLAPDGGPLLYLSGREVASDLPRVLAAQGFAVEQVVTYEAVPAARFPEAAREALAGGGLDAVLVYSPRSARILGTLAVQAGMMDALAGLVWVCLSPAVAESAREVGAARVVVAERPAEPALLAALESLTTQTGLATAPPKRV